MSRQQQVKKKSSRARRRKKRIIILVIEIIVLLILLVGAFLFAKLNRLDGVDVSGAYKGKDLKGYTNIALFGIDSRDTGTYDKDNHADVMIVATIDAYNKHINLTSVYRDTYLDCLNADGSSQNFNLRKANDAYFLGGPEQAISMLNKNLDLDIDDYVAFDFNAVAEIVDLMGGLDIQITEEEMGHINNYLVETCEVLGIPLEQIDEWGDVHLDGVQTVAYCRIRFTEGDDFRRTQRQRIVIQLMAEKAQKMSISQLNKILDKVIDNVSTSMSNSDIISTGISLMSYGFNFGDGFPYEKWCPDTDAGSSVVAVDLLTNVKEMHEKLFPEDKDYTPSEEVKRINDAINAATGTDRNFTQYF